MTDSEIAALLRALLERFRDDADEADVSMHPGVAPGLQQSAIEEETATEGSSLDDLGPAGREALCPVPTMWRQ